MYYIAPIPKQFMDSIGVPYRNGTVEVFLNGDTRHAPVYADCNGTAQVENPFVLDAHGFWNAFVEPGVLLDYVVRDKHGNVIFSFYGVKIDALGNISHDSTLVGTGDRARPLGISPSVLEALHQEVQSEAAARAEGDAGTLAAANFYTNESVAAHNANPDAHPDMRQAIVAEKTQREAADATEKSQRESADAALQNAIDTHAGRTDNPHNVTAGQVGAYTKQETEDRISDAISGEVGGWLGNLTVAEVNALTTHKKGDSVTLLDAGTVTPGNVTVDVGDDIMWVDSLGVWQPKITDHLHHDETLVGTGSANDPLGVDTTVIATKAYVDEKGLEEDNGVLYFR